MFCRNCGFKLENGDLFCPSCGNKVEPLPNLEAFDATVIADAPIPDAQQNKNAYKGLLFEEREPSYNNVIPQPQTEEKIPVQQEAETAFAQPEPITPQPVAQSREPEAPPAPDFSAVKPPLFSGNDEWILSPPLVTSEPDSDNGETAVAAEPETEFSAAEQETQIADTDNAGEPYVMPDPTNPIREDTYARASENSFQESVVFEPAEETVIAPAAEETAFAPAEEVAVVASSEENETVVAPMDDSYNVYSGAVPGANSQDFRYPTNDNAYPDLPASVSPQFDNMVQLFDEDATVGVDYTQPAVGYQMPVNQPYANPQGNPPRSFAGYDESFAQQNAYAVPPQEPKKKNTAMWIIIACISVMIIAIGATCAVILTQYDSFGDFFASFGVGDKDDDEDDEEKEEDDEEKADNEKDKTERATELVTELTTIEATTLPPTTEKTFDGYCGAQVYYAFDEASKVLTIEGAGEMQNYANVVTPWAGKDVRRVEIGEGVTSVTPGAFTEITPDSIYLSSTVSSFDVLAVNKFGGIEVSPSNRQYKSVNEVLFDKSGSILIAYPNQKINTSYAIPEGVRIIDELAFYEATNLNSLSISSTVEYIDNYAFKGCVNIHRLDMPATVTEIRSGVFYGWLDSQDIYIANAKTKVVEDWNEGCNANVTVAS